ncbi:MAG: dihydroorotase [Lachnospiraceae bacterium]|nr:dihydroorotase [Lachnospiraceae bacterium]
MIYIKNGMVIDPEEDRIYGADLVIRDGRIQRIISRQPGELSQPGRDAGEMDIDEVEMTVIDGNGLAIGPGLADTHVHFRDPGFTYKEDIETGAGAAAKGGFTQIILMANTKPCVDNPDTLSYVLGKGRKTGIHIGSCVNVTRGMAGKELVDMEGLSQAGAAGFTDDGIPLLDGDIVKEAMERAGKLHKPISFHEENPGMIANNGINAGKASDFYGIGGSPREAEIDLVKRDAALALETGAEVVIQHISSRETVELVRKAKAAGAHIHGEATPHHFTLTEEAVIEKGTLAKMNPPLRTREDRLAIIEGIKDGTIDLIATDHAPHSRQEKEQSITKAPSGIIGLETALSLGIRELVDKGYLTLPELFKRMSTAPCALYHLPGGRISEGAPADLVLFAPEETWTVTEEFASKSANSPFIGEEMPGVVYYTICDGRIVYKKI